MNRSELKNWAKEKMKPKMWLILGVLLVSGIITNLGYYKFYYEDGQLMTYSISIGWILYFVEVGTTYFMVKIINDEEAVFKDIFRFSSDFARCFIASLLEIVFIFLYTLLLIIPGFIKAYGYSLVPYLLADDKYKDLGAKDILNKSEEMMKGHKMDLFMLQLSFLGWLFLGALTLGLAFIYVTPYMRTTITKFLYDIKVQNEK